MEVCECSSKQARMHVLCLPGIHIAIHLKPVTFDGRSYSHGNDIMRLNQCSGPLNCVTQICLICKNSLLTAAQMRYKTVAFLSSQIKVPECQNDISQTAHSWEMMGLLNCEQGLVSCVCGCVHLLISLYCYW